MCSFVFVPDAPHDRGDEQHDPPAKDCAPMMMAEHDLAYGRTEDGSAENRRKNYTQGRPACLGAGRDGEGHGNRPASLSGLFINRGSPEPPRRNVLTGPRALAAFFALRSPTRKTVERTKLD